MKTTSLNDYQKIEVTIYDFSHDINGNATANYVIQGYKTLASVSPSNTLLDTKRRKQIGYSDKPEGFAKMAFIHANLSSDDFKVIANSGSRSEGRIFITLAREDLPELNYRQSQIERLKLIDGENYLKIQITSGQGKTNYQDITRAQMLAIMKIINYA